MSDVIYNISSGFFDSVNGDRLYSAGDMNKPYKRVIADGIFPTPQGTPSTDFQVVAVSGMSVAVLAGNAMIGARWAENTDDVGITIAGNSSSSPRIDSIFLHIDTGMDTRAAGVVYRQGTAAGTPTAPAMVQTDNITELRLADILVAPSAAIITQANITDQRGGSDCPWVAGLIQQVDTSALFDQYRAAYAEQQQDQANEWNTFMDHLARDYDISMSLRKHESTYTSTAAASLIPINIDGYDTTKDLLQVYINGIFAVEGTHYIVKSATQIQLTNAISAGQKVHFVIYKAVMGGAQPIIPTDEQVQDAVDAYMDAHPGALVVDPELSDTSTHAIQNKAVTEALAGVNGRLSEQGEIVDRLNEGGLDIKDEVIEEQIADWFNEHPEATTTVQDGSLTEIKFSDNLKLKTIKEYVTPEMFGAKGDGVTDDTTAWENAILSGKVIVAINNYLITRPLYLDNDVYVFGVIYNSVSDGVIVDGKTQKNYRLNVQSKTQNSSQFKGVTIRNCTNCTFEIITRYFYYGIFFIGDGRACSYNAINEAFLSNSKYFVFMTTASRGWINENYLSNIRTVGESNTAYKGSDYSVFVDPEANGLAVNSLHYTNCCFEGTHCAIYLNNCRESTFYNIRTEACTYAAIIEGSSNRNVVTISYGVVNSLNNGSNNIIIDSFHVAQNFKLIATTGSMVNKTASNTYNGCCYGLYRVDDGNNKYNYLSNALADAEGLKCRGEGILGFLVDVSKNKQIVVNANANNGFRWGVIPFDSNGDYVENADILSGLSSFSEHSGGFGKYYSLGADATSETGEIIFRTSTIASAYIGIIFKNQTVIKKLSLYGDETNFEKYSFPVLQLNSIPTSSGWYAGQTVFSSTSAVKWVWDGTQWNQQNL